MQPASAFRGCRRLGCGCLVVVFLVMGGVMCAAGFGLSYLWVTVVEAGVAGVLSTAVVLSAMVLSGVVASPTEGVVSPTEGVATPAMERSPTVTTSPMVRRSPMAVVNPMVVSGSIATVHPTATADASIGREVGWGMVLMSIMLAAGGLMSMIWERGRRMGDATPVGLGGCFLPEPLHLERVDEEKEVDEVDEALVIWQDGEPF